MSVPFKKVPDIRLAAVEIPAAGTPEGKLFRTLQTVFEAYRQDELPTPMLRMALRESAESALAAYFVEKLAERPQRPRNQVK